MHSNNSTLKPLIQVSVGVLYQKIEKDQYAHQTQYQYLFAKRPAGKPFTGFWEFPGGKIEIDESPKHALTRELQEELNVKINSEDCSELMPSFIFTYPTYRVHLHVFLVKNWQGQPEGSENQTLQWADLKTARKNNTMQPMLDAADIILSKLADWEMINTQLNKSDN